MLACDSRELSGPTQIGNRRVTDSVDRDNLGSVECDHSVVQVFVRMGEGADDVHAGIRFGPHRSAGITAMSRRQAYEPTAGVIPYCPERAQGFADRDARSAAQYGRRRRRYSACGQRTRSETGGKCDDNGGDSGEQSDPERCGAPLHAQRVV
jgi:hypothetical protein